MPLKQSPNGGGNEANGSISTMYCAYCYENGTFKQPDWDVSQMRNFVKEYLKKREKTTRFFGKPFHHEYPQIGAMEANC